MEDIKVVGLAPSKPGGKTNWKVISAIIGIIVLSVGVIAGIFLVRQQQDIREQAAGNCDNPESIVQCPRSDGALVSCTPPDSNGNAQISVCDSRFLGRPEVCGGTQYCCNGTAWVTDMSACSCDAKAPTGVTVADLTSTSATLKWSGATGGKLRLWVSKNADLSCSVAESCPANDLSITPVTTNEYALTNLTPNTKYYWRVMAWTKEGCDSASSIVNFTTLASDTTLPSCGAVVPNCYESTVVGTTACNDGLKTVYCCKPGQTSQNNTCTNGGVTAGGVCDINISLRGGCTSGLTCQKDNQDIYRCSTSSSNSSTTTPSMTSTPTMTATATSFSSKTATPTATSTSKATTTTSSSKTATPTVKATATGSGSPFPVPETGADFPTMLGVTFGVIMLILSLGFAL